MGTPAWPIQSSEREQFFISWLICLLTVVLLTGMSACYYYQYWYMYHRGKPSISWLICLLIVVLLTGVSACYYYQYWYMIIRKWAVFHQLAILSTDCGSINRCVCLLLLSVLLHDHKKECTLPSAR
jgi:hypothetical protein